MKIIKTASGLLLAGLLAGGLVACGGGSSSSPTPTPDPSPAPGDGDTGNGGETPQTLTGVFIDSAVQDIGYRTTTQQGVTNADGEFEYVEGETVTFFIGELELPPVTAKALVTPLDIAGTDDINHQVVVNIARLLQSLDADGDPSNGIQIPEAAAGSAATVDFDLPIEQFATLPAVTNLVANSGSVTTTLVSIDDALAHLETSIGALSSAIVGAWSPEIEGVDIVLVFFADGTYVHAEGGNDDPNGTDGMERGAYTWDPASGAFKSACPSVDTNGQWGLSDQYPDEDCSGTTATVTVEGDTLTFTPTDEDPFPLQRVADATNPLVGAWAPNFEGAEVVFAFLANGTYIHAENGTANEHGQTGIEVGSYTWNPATGAFKSECPSIDTNGQWGLSDQFPDEDCSGSEAKITIINDEALFMEAGEDTFVARRVDATFVATEGYQLNLLGRTATSEITSSRCPSAKLGWTYTFDETGMTMEGTDSLSDCQPGEEETMTMTWVEIGEIDDIPFNCGGPTCTLAALNRHLEGTDEDSRPFESMHWHMPGKTLIYTKRITGGQSEGDVWTEIITLQ